jgi:pimeloyl-ACP methyl ester carboxylesterase
VPTATAPDGALLAYDVVGDGATDVLFFHGAAGSRDYYTDLLRELDTSRLRAVVADLRGHGDSGGAEAPYTLELLSADALAVAEPPISTARSSSGSAWARSSRSTSRSPRPNG